MEAIVVAVRRGRRKHSTRGLEESSGERTARTWQAVAVGRTDVRLQRTLASLHGALEYSMCDSTLAGSTVKLQQREAGGKSYPDNNRI